MLDFYAFLWPWLAACFAIGGATGALAPGQPSRKRPARWLVWAALASAAAGAALSLGAAQGEIALNIESALGCFIAFITGCILGALAFRRNIAAQERWALGLAAAALLWLVAAHVAQPAYQTILQKRAAALAQGAGADASSLALSGRDVVAAPAIAGNKELLARIAAIPGVRRVLPAPAAQEQTPPPGRPAETKPDATATIPAPASPAGTALGGPPASQREAQAALPEGGLDAAACQRALDAVAATEPVAFRSARATVNRRVALALDKAAEIIRRCPETTIEVRGYGDEGGAGALAQRRAEAAENYLRREGVAGRRLVAVGAQDARRTSAIDYVVR